MGTPSSPFWKFRGIDANTFKLLINQELWFSHPDYFNDPFDTKVNIKHVIEEVKDTLNKPEALVAEIEKCEPAYNEFLKRRYLFSVNQEGETQKGYFKPFEEVLMWSHYANQHTGICLGLTMYSVRQRVSDLSHQNKNYPDDNWMAGSTGNPYSERPVYYNTDVFKNGFLKFVEGGGWGYHLLDKFFFVKSKNWQYEHEYRFVLQGKRHNGTARGEAVSFDKEDLQHIIFGLKISCTDKEAVTNIIRDKRWDHVQLWQAKRGNELFSLDFERVEL